MGRRLAALLLALAPLGGARAAEPAAPAPEAVEAGWCLGRVVPAEAVPLRAPRLGAPPAGLELDGSSLRLVRLAREGARVRPDEELAVFGFPERAVREAVEADLRHAQASMDRELAQLEAGLAALAGELESARLAQKKAALEVKKKAALSRRDAELVDLTARRADFEVSALERTRAARQAVLAATRADHLERLRQARQVWAELEQWKSALSLRAPAAGQVVLPPVEELGRPARAGDRLSPGAELLWLAVGDRLAVEFVLPERLLASCAPGAEVRLQALPPRGELRARVLAVDDTPVALGDGVGYRARAELPAGAAGLRPGQAVRVAP
ncbi:MAG TPA: HlyD family efflux transporter periplasmic adaptor subunit [Myxococcota bacterium]|nr:HlyD family efflux transporter periplasmic adaptor subunit [Myxococcota bacterium]HRY96393.1 HlyD family efflux transporter periplasmic adaptor subunit [Myxococcota bacterium]HSA20841.1 HlyD family efflux transporter periplasmic adaptor subunit [Myxococcota bacterium]